MREGESDGMSSSAETFLLYSVMASRSVSLVK